MQPKSGGGATYLTISVQSVALKFTTPVLQFIVRWLASANKKWQLTYTTRLLVENGRLLGNSVPFRQGA